MTTKQAWLDDPYTQDLLREINTTLLELSQKWAGGEYMDDKTNFTAVGNAQMLLSLSAYIEAQDEDDYREAQVDEQ